ncbi:MAG: hypothetical protein AAFY08_03860 [Planctomycetota bacterium]
MKHLIIPGIGVALIAGVCPRTNAAIEPGFLGPNATFSGGPVGNTVTFVGGEVGSVAPDGEGNISWSPLVDNDPGEFDFMMPDSWGVEFLPVEYNGVSTPAGAVFNPDPFVAYAIAFTNMTSSTMDFVFEFTINSSETIVNPEIEGAVAVTLLDTGSADGVGITDGSASLGLGTESGLYNAIVDGTVVRSMLTSLVVPPNPNVTLDTFANEVSAVDLNLNDQFGIRYAFSLTPGDTVTFNGSFELIPEPGAFALVAAGLGVIGFRHRSA